MRTSSGAFCVKINFAIEAGTPDQYKAAQLRAAAADEAERKRGPLLDTEIRKLQVERELLLNEQAATAEVVTQMTGLAASCVAGRLPSSNIGWSLTSDAAQLAARGDGFSPAENRPG